MGSIAKFRKKQLGFLAAAVMATAYMPTAAAMVNGLPEVDNEKGFKGVKFENSEDPSIMKLRIEGTNGKAKGIANWKDFSIEQGNTVKFVSDLKNWMVLNRVTGVKESRIYGNINGEGGTVFLVNPQGILFGDTAHVDVGSLVASTLDISDRNFIDGTYTFTQSGKKGAAIRNLADINAADDGVVVLLAHQVFNWVDDLITDEHREVTLPEYEGIKKLGNGKGSINAGQVALVAGKNVTLKNLGKEVKGRTAPADGETVISYADKIGVKNSVIMGQYTYFER